MLSPLLLSTMWTIFQWLKLSRIEKNFHGVSEVFSVASTCLTVLYLFQIAESIPYLKLLYWRSSYNEFQWLLNIWKPWRQRCRAILCNVTVLVPCMYNFTVCEIEISSWEEGHTKKAETIQHSPENGQQQSMWFVLNCVDRNPWLGPVMELKGTFISC